MKANAITAVIRDITLLAVGTFILIHQTVTGEFNAFLVGAALACYGLPGGVGIRSLTRGSRDTQDTPELSQQPRSRGSSRR